MLCIRAISFAIKNPWAWKLTEIKLLSGKTQTDVFLTYDHGEIVLQ